MTTISGADETNTRFIASVKALIVHSHPDRDREPRLIAYIVPALSAIGEPKNAALRVNDVIGQPASWKGRCCVGTRRHRDK